MCNVEKEVLEILQEINENITDDVQIDLLSNCTIVKQVDTNSANLLSSRSRRYLAVIGSLSFIGRQVA